MANQRALELNVYPTEIRGDAKALKVFYGDRLDFVDETLKKKELVLFLMQLDAKVPNIESLKAFRALDLDPTMVSSYIRALLNDAYLPLVGDEVDELYTELTAVP